MELTDDEIYDLAEKSFPKDAFRMQISLITFARAVLAAHNAGAQGAAEKIATLFVKNPPGELGPTDEPESQYRFGYNTAIEDALVILDAHPQPMPQTDAARDVLAERARQVNVEGWTAQHDDEHDPGDLCAAGSAYALAASDKLNPHSQGDGDYGRNVPDIWPENWHTDWWKLTTPRRDLVKAAALILAEIERLDRAKGA